MSLTVEVTGLSNITLPQFPRDLTAEELQWYTKNLNGILYGTVRFTSSQTLEQKKEEKEERTAEELDEYAQERVGKKSWADWKKDDDLLGPLETWKQKTVRTYWEDVQYHGSFSFYTSITDEEANTRTRYTYEARFTHGNLDEILLLSEEEYELPE
jgi:hypothetical protein